MVKEVKAKDFIDLKNKIKQEVLRRKYTGSVESYGGVNYDFKINPGNGKPLEIEHINKMVIPLRAVDPTGIYPEKMNGNIIEGIEVLDARVTLLESKPKEGGNHGCSTSCTGLCSSTCTGSCTSGCSGSCSGCSGCGGACSSGCTGCGSCTGCGGACDYGCGGDCSTQCGRGCASVCSDNCTGSSEPLPGSIMNSVKSENTNRSFWSSL